MAKKLRTGFELPFSNATDQNYGKTFPNNTPYLFNNLVDGFYNLNGIIKNRSTSMSISTSTNHNFIYSNYARTKIGTRGTFYSGNQDPNGWSLLAFDLSQFANGFFANYWLSANNSSTMYLRLIYLNNGIDFYTGYIDNSGTNTVIRIEKNGVDQSSYDIGYKLDTIVVSSGTYYNTHVSVDNSGVISLSINGSTALTHATGIAFSSFTQLGACMARGQNTAFIDDLAINDGSGSTDNGMPNSIRGYNFFDQSTLDSQTGFSTVGGSTILANLTDGDDSTRVNCSNDLSEMNFSLPTLSATGMSETASNFLKIDAINIYARQIEATKANSVLKAKITDSVTNANREENISLPLTVANDSTTMFDDGSNDFSLSNLDSGNLDLKITFDKP